MQRTFLSVALLTGVLFAASSNGERQWMVGAIVIEGNRALSNQKIREVMETRPSHFWRRSPYVRSKLKFDLRTIEALYRQNGFLDAVVTLGRTVYDTSRSRVAITIVIQEGSPTVVESVGMSGDAHLVATSRREGLATRAGSPLNTSAVRKDANAIAASLADWGYLFAKVIDSVAIDSVQKTARVTFDTRAGPLCFAGPMSVEGLAKVRHSVVEREIRFAAGDTLGAPAMRSAVRSLYGTGLFDFADLGISGGEPDSVPAGDTAVVPLTLTLKETKFFTIDASVGYGTYDHFRAALRSAYANCFGRGHRLGLDATTNRFSQRAEVGYAVPYVFGMPLRAETAGYIEHHGVTYEGLFEGIRLTFSPRHPGRFAYRIWANYEHTDTIYVRDTAGTGVLPDSLKPRNTQSVGVDVTLDGRQRDGKRTRGALVRFSPEIAGLALKGTNQYYRGLADLRGYYDISGSIKLSFAASIGYAHAYGDPAPVPPQARYYIGSEGLRPIRGYPTDTAGGNMALVINLFEARFPLYKWFGIAFFSDGGAAWESARDVSLRDIRWVAGPGISITTPIGELCADFAWRLTGRRGFGTPFFSLGSTF